MIDSIQPVQQCKSFVGVSAPADCILEESSSLNGLAAVERGQAAVEQLFRLALPLSHGASGALDVRAGACVAAVEKQCARPDVDRLLELRGEVMVKSGEEQLLDLGVPIPVQRGVELARTIGRKRF